jgi:transcriptional antiterminator NusG
MVKKLKNEQAENLEAETLVAEATEGDGIPLPEEGAEAAPEHNPNFKWYIIHAYSGFERKVKESLESRVRAYHLEDRVGRIEIPTEPTVETRNGVCFFPATCLWRWRWTTICGTW